MVHVGFASACIVDARACVCVSPRVHCVHSVMALCDYAIAYVSHRFASLVVLRASEMHGYACGRVRVPRRWFCLECMVGRRVAGGPSRTITHDFACVGGGGGEEGSSAWWQVVQSLGSCIALRASAVGASLRCVWRVRADEASVVCGLADVRVLPLRWVCSPCGYARLRVRGGGGGGRIVSFASLRVVSSRSSVSLLCVHVRGRVDAGLRLLRPRDLWVSLVSSHVHVCSEMIGRVFACLQRSDWSRV